MCFVCWCFDIFPDEEKTAIVTYFLLYVYLSHSCSFARPIIRLLFLLVPFSSNPQQPKTRKQKRRNSFLHFLLLQQNTKSTQYRMLKRSLKPLARLASASSSSSFVSSSRFDLELFLQEGNREFFSRRIRRLSSSSIVVFSFPSHEENSAT